MNPLNHILQNFKNMETKLQQIEVIGEASAGLVKVKMNGTMDILDIQVDNEIYQTHKQVVLDLITAASNQAKNKVKQRLQQEMQTEMGGFQLPTSLMSLLPWGK